MWMVLIVLLVAGLAAWGMVHSIRKGLGLIEERQEKSRWLSTSLIWGFSHLFFFLNWSSWHLGTKVNALLPAVASDDREEEDAQVEDDSEEIPIMWQDLEEEGSIPPEEEQEEAPEEESLDVLVEQEHHDPLPLSESAVIQLLQTSTLRNIGEQQPYSVYLQALKIVLRVFYEEVEEGRPIGRNAFGSVNFFKKSNWDYLIGNEESPGLLRLAEIIESLVPGENSLAENAQTLEQGWSLLEQMLVANMLAA